MTQMIDLDTPITPSEEVEMDFTPIPKGKYVVKFTALKDWKKTTHENFEAVVYDDKKQALKDADKKTIKQNIGTVTIYDTTATLDVVGGEFDGRKLFMFLTTNPNAPWGISRFVKGLGAGNVPASKFKDFIGTLMEVSVDIEKYPKEDKIDSTTGEITYKESMSRNKITFVKPVETPF